MWDTDQLSRQVSQLRKKFYGVTEIALVQVDTLRLPSRPLSTPILAIHYSSTISGLEQSVYCRLLFGTPKILEAID